MGRSLQQPSQCRQLRQWQGTFWSCCSPILDRSAQPYTWTLRPGQCPSAEFARIRNCDVGKEHKDAKCNRIVFGFLAIAVGGEADSSSVSAPTRPERKPESLPCCDRFGVSA